MRFARWTWAAFAIACSSPAAETATAPRAETETETETETAPTLAPNDPLHDLRARLERARVAAADEQRVTGPAEAGALIGMSRAAIVDALGPAGRCQLARSTECPHGQPCREVERPSPAPCTAVSDIFYSFYHLPEGWNGGGPELLLQFDESDHCTSADWHFTQ